MPASNALIILRPTTLVAKKLNPEKVSDFRPISLLNLAMKFLTKILANKLQKVILRVIHRNQYGFLQGRSIHDFLTWAFEYISSLVSPFQKGNYSPKVGLC